MSAYLGMLGRLVPIYSNPTMDVSGDEAYAFTKTLEGRVKAQVRPVSRRSWELSARAASPTDVGTLNGFASGEWGMGPFVWVAPGAASVNLLTPEVARCGPQAVFSPTVSRAGPMSLGVDGWAGSSLTTSDPTATLWVGATKAPVPVIPGQPVTASAYMLGAGAKVRLHWYMGDGSLASQVVTSSGSGMAGTPQRLHVTAIPPAGAVSCTMSTTRALQIARPAITWTDKLFPWGDGQGCLNAVVSSIGSTVQAASLRDPGSNYSDMKFTITEVG